MDLSRTLNKGFGQRLSEVLQEKYKELCESERMKWESIEMHGLRGEFELGEVLDLILKVKRL